MNSDSFCETANGIECFLYIRTKFLGLKFVELILKYGGVGEVEKTVNPITENISIDLNFEFLTSLSIESNLTFFQYTSPTTSKNFSIDLKYYEDKRTISCQIFDPSTGNFANTCSDRKIYSDVYTMRLENDTAKSFKDEMKMQGSYYRTKFFTRIIIQYNYNNFIARLTFYPELNKNPNILVIDMMTFINDNLVMDYSNENGKEMVISVKIDDLNNTETFYTDSNGLYYMKRKRSHEYENDTYNIPMSYFPVVSYITINNENDKLKKINSSLMILNDRSQGGTSYRDGEVELLFNRYFNTDDDLGLAENVILQEKNYINHQIIIQDYDEKPKNETMIDLINRKNFVYIPFVKIVNIYENIIFENETKELENAFADIPFYIKINFHPLNNYRFIVKVQDIYHLDDNETQNYVEKVKQTLRQPCLNQKKCKYLKYICKETLLGGLRREDDNLNARQFTSISHRIRTLFCRSIKK